MSWLNGGKLKPCRRHKRSYCLKCLEDCGKFQDIIFLQPVNDICIFALVKSCFVFFVLFMINTKTNIFGLFPLS